MIYLLLPKKVLIPMLPRLDLRTSLQVTRNHGLLTSLPRWAVFICHLKKPSPRQLEHQSRTGGPAAPPGPPRTRLWQKVLWDRPRHSAETEQVFPSLSSLAHAHFFLPVVPALSSSFARVTEGINAALWPAQSWYTRLYSSRRALQHGKSPVLTQPCYGSNSETVSAK